MPRRKTDAEFKKEVYELVGDEYTFTEPYTNSHTKIKVKHNKCNNIYKVTPTNFLTGNRCPYCSSSAKKTDGEFKQEIYNLVGNEYTFLDTYINDKAKLRVKHNRCGRIYKVAPHDFLRVVAVILVLVKLSEKQILNLSKKYMT